MIPPSSQSPENEEATLKTESAGGFPTPPVVTFTEAANLGTSEPGAKGHTYSPTFVEEKFRELRLLDVLGTCGLFLLPDNGDWARGVTDHGLRYASHQRPPYASLPPAAHRYHSGTHALGQVDAKRQIT